MSSQYHSVSWDNSHSNGLVDGGLSDFHSHVLKGTRRDHIMGPEGTVLNTKSSCSPPKSTKIASFRIFSIMVFRSISSSFWIPGKDSPGTAGCSFSVYPKGLGWFWVRTSNDHQRSSNIFHPKVGKKSSSEPHPTDPTVLFGTRPWPVWLSSLPRDSWFPFMKGSTRQLGSGISTGPSSCGMFAQTTDHMTQNTTDINRWSTQILAIS